jgi:hypothetical protein
MASHIGLSPLFWTHRNQRLLGRGDVGVTMSVYSHWFKDRDSGAAGRYIANFADIDSK